MNSWRSTFCAMWPNKSSALKNFVNLLNTSLYWSSYLSINSWVLSSARCSNYLCPSCAFSMSFCSILILSLIKSSTSTIWMFMFFVVTNSSLMALSNSYKLYLLALRLNWRSNSRMQSFISRLSLCCPSSISSHFFKFAFNSYWIFSRSSCLGIDLN